MSKHYQARVFIGQPDRMSLKLVVASCAEFLHGDVLDVGAGPSDRYGHLVLGKLLRMDISAGNGIDLVGTVDNIPVADASLDAILCTQVLEHVREPWRAPAEFFRVLKPGGYVVVTVPQFNELHEEPHDYFRYTKYGLESLFSSVGFSTVKEFRRGGFFSTQVQAGIRYMTDRMRMYERPFWGRVFGRCATAASKLSLWLDGIDRSRAAQKHALGWCFVFRKTSL